MIHTNPVMTDDREPRLRRLEDAIEAFLDRDESVSSEDLLAHNEGLADLLRPMLEQEDRDGDGEPDDLSQTLVIAASRADSDRHDGSAARSDCLRHIGNLDVVREIGRGGMGIVFEAVDRLLKRRVAVKIMLRASDLSASSIVRFRREAELAASISHPSIVPVHALGETGSELYLTMGLVESASLADVLAVLRRDSDGAQLSAAMFDAAVDEAIQMRFADAQLAERTRGKSHIETVVEWLLQVADALAHAHQKGIIHRDVKPANILIDGAGRAYLTDFGLACVADDPRVTQLGSSPGTPQYMAPEQINDERGALGPATDVFALGVTLYEALTLQRAFPGETLPAVMFAVTTRDPVDPVTLNPALSRDLVAILQHAMQKDPAARYPSAREFADDLQSWLRGDGVSVRPLSWSAQMTRRVRRESWRLAVIVLLLVGLPVVTALAISSANREPQSQVGEQVIRDRWLDDQLASGFREAGEGDVEAAQACIAEILQREPRSEAGVALQSVLDRRDGDRAALQALEQHAEIVAGSPALLRRRATLLARIGDKSANQAAKGLPEELVDFDAFLVGYGLLELGHSGATEKYGEARRMLHRAIVTADRPRSLFYYEWLHAAAHDQAKEDIESAMAAIVRLWPDDSTGLFWGAFAHNAIGDGDDAIEALRQALRQEPDFQPAAVNLAHLLRRSGQADQALQLLREVLPRAPRPAQVLAELGMALVALRKVPEAIAELKAAVAAHPDAWALRSTYASALIVAQQLDEAEQQLRLVLQSRPQELGARHSLATVQLRKGDAASARTNLEQVVARRPSAQHFYELGIACGALRDAAAACTAYERCLQLDDAHAQALVNLASLRLRGGDAKAAEPLLRRAVAAQPQLLQARRTLLRLLDGRPADAVAMCRDWAQASPEDAEPLRHLAAAMVQDNKPEQLPEALAIAIRANTMMKDRDGPTVHVLGRVLLANGEVDKAKATVERALTLLDPGDRFAPYYRQQMQATLAKCERALQEANK